MSMFEGALQRSEVLLYNIYLIIKIFVKQPVFSNDFLNPIPGKIIVEFSFIFIMFLKKKYKLC